MQLLVTAQMRAVPRVRSSAMRAARCSAAYKRGQTAFGAGEGVSEGVPATGCCLRLHARQGDRGHQAKGAPGAGAPGASSSYQDDQVQTDR